MTDRPYTDEDLRAEAARQHALSVEDPDFMGIGERMEGAFIDSTVVDEDPDFQPEGNTWDQLGRADFDAAQRSIDGLLTSAADVSEWAINLGADGLEPDEHTFQLGAQGPGADDPDMPFVRLHFAFNPAATDEERDRFVMQLTKVIAANL
ncbi:hypothetical protein [Streptomyces sp. SAS_275]|uniref:hypothetical protein n=1 Tax=Streptomyces sp. SAS_275 TaxID=3412746 RepID=UPI00403C7ACA